MKKIAAIAFVAVLLLIVLGQQAPKETSQALPSMPVFKLDDVESFTIQSKGEISLQGKQEGKQWLLLGTAKPLYLQETAVGQLLHDLQTMSVKRIASSKAEHHIRFAVSDYQVTLKNKQGEILLDVFIGKTATDLRSTYIRLADQDTVITVDKTLTWQVKRTPDAWLKTEEDPEQE